MLFITAIIGLVFFGFGGYWLYSLLRSKFDKNYSPALKPWMSFVISLVAFAVSGTMANKIVPDASNAELSKQILAKVDSLQSKITMDKFKQLQTGMSYQQVVSILGKEGVELSSNDLGGYKTIMYQWSESFANMTVMFQNDRLVQKSQFGLE